MMKNMLLAAALAALCASSTRAVSNDCLFDGTCAPGRSADAAEPLAVDASGPRAAARPLGRADGLIKGAQEGAEFGLLGTLTPAVALVSEGFGRNMSRGYDGARRDNGGGDAYEYGGIALAVLLYIPALVLGGLGGLIGGAIGAASPETARGWDAESFLAGDSKRG